MRPLKHAGAITTDVKNDNVQLVRAALDAYNRDGPESFFALLDPEVEWVADRSDMGRVTYRGLEGVRRSFDELYEGFASLRFDLDELRAVGESVVVLGQMCARGRATGIEARIPLALVLTVGPNGKLVRYESFREPSQALEAVGLSKPDTHTDTA